MDALNRLATPDASALAPRVVSNTPNIIYAQSIMDIVLIIISCGFFALSWGLVRLCEKV